MFTAYVASWFVVKRDENNAQKTEPVTKKEETIIYVDKVEM
jgi:hypothetical protein